MAQILAQALTRMTDGKADVARAHSLFAMILESGRGIFLTQPFGEHLSYAKKTGIHRSDALQR
jgi:hypothetical protein